MEQTRQKKKNDATRKNKRLNTDKERVQKNTFFKNEIFAFGLAKKKEKIRWRRKIKKEQKKNEIKNKRENRKNELKHRRYAATAMERKEKENMRKKNIEKEK